MLKMFLGRSLSITDDGGSWSQTTGLDNLLNSLDNKQSIGIITTTHPPYFWDTERGKQFLDDSWYQTWADLDT